MCSKQTASYGSWPSPITPDLMLGTSVGLGEIQRCNEQLYWIEMRPEESGRYAIVCRNIHGHQEDAIAGNFNARTRVHEYGGASYIATPAGLFFCNFADQAIYQTGKDGNARRLTDNPDCRYADLVFDEKRQRIICVREDHSVKDSEPINTIVAIEITSGNETVLDEGADFYSSPRLNADNSRLCWIGWMHPNMPWDTTTLYLADMNNSGQVENKRTIAGGHDESVTQPVWSPSGSLFYVSDKNGWWNLYHFDGDRTQCVLEMDAEFAVPQWSFGERNYDFIDAENILLAYWQDGFARLARLNLANRSLHNYALPYTDIESVICEGSHAWFLAASPTSFPAIIEFDMNQESCSVVRRANELELDPDYISVGQSISFDVGDGRQAHAFFYSPANKDFTGPAAEKPPLIVISHGGPTGASHNGLKMVVQYFTSRGFAVIDVNYGGSSGYGRDYRQRLHGQWRIVDVNDCSKAALYAVEQDWADAERLAIRGGSAGGFTTLAALAFTDVFKAGASHYGVSDLEALARDTHKFESRYLDSLVGPYPAARDIYQQRSPIHAVANLSCPVIFFQGLEDKIVLPNQAEMMVSALKDKGIPVAYLAYDGEQHGFRQAKNIKRTLEAELFFYSRIFNFECVDEIEPVQFE